MWCLCFDNLFSFSLPDLSPLIFSLSGSGKKQFLYMCILCTFCILQKKKKRKERKGSWWNFRLPWMPWTAVDGEQQGATAQPPSHTLSQGNPKPQNPGVLRTQNEGEMTLSHIPHATARYHISRYLLLCREGALPSSIFIHTWYLRKNLHMPYTHSAFMFVPQT